MQWHPIETAPKDQILDIFGNGYRYPNCIWTTPSEEDEGKMCWCYQEEGCGLWWDVPVPNPTHWIKIDRPEQEPLNDK